MNEEAEKAAVVTEDVYDGVDLGGECDMMDDDIDFTYAKDDLQKLADAINTLKGDEFELGDVSDMEEREN